MKILHSKIYLNRNEYFFRHPAEVKKALSSAYQENFISHYARPSQINELKQALAKVYGVSEKKVLLGHGAEDIFVKLLSWFRKEISSIVIEDFSWANYLHIAGGFQYQVHTVPVLESKTQFIFNKKGFEEKLASLKSAIIFLTTPNNPTGHRIEISDLVSLATQFPNHLFMIDAVYNEIIEPEYKQIFPLENCIFVGSFSKFFGLPGLRLGYAIGNLPEAFQLNLGLQPSTIDAALAALFHYDHYKKNRDFMLAYSKELLDRKYPHLHIYPTFAPFFLVKVLPKKEKLTENSFVFRRAEEKSGVVPKIIFRDGECYLRFGLGPTEICQKVTAYLKALI
jgi:histidinol-phosphate aminotransferase